MTKVLIIGAGLSGLTAALELKNRGHEVIAIDKGQGIGGRMATRREGDARFDHGAQFFTARSAEFQTEVQNWQRAGAARKWFEGFPSPDNAKPNDCYPRYCGTNGMTGIGKFLARDLDVRLGEEIQSLHRDKNGWTAINQLGKEYSGEQLLLTCPIPQALNLFDTSGQTLPDAMRGVLQSVTFEPCFAVLAILKGVSKIPSPGALYLSGEPISWIADNFQKGISKVEGAMTIHSTGAFARVHYDEDENEVGKILLDAAREYSGAEVSSFQVRRWRYAKPENPLDIGIAQLPELNLCFAGDSLNGAKIEGAFLSGLMAAGVLGHGMKRENILNSNHFS